MSSQIWSKAAHLICPIHIRVASQPYRRKLTQWRKQLQLRKDQFDLRPGKILIWLSCCMKMILTMCHPFFASQLTLYAFSSALRRTPYWLWQAYCVGDDPNSVNMYLIPCGWKVSTKLIKCQSLQRRYCTKCIALKARSLCLYALEMNGTQVVWIVQNRAVDIFLETSRIVEKYVVYS